MEDHSERLGGQRVLPFGSYEDVATLLDNPTLIFKQRDATQDVLQEQIEYLINKLDPNQADLLRRVYWEQQTQAEIAADLGVSQQAVGQRLDTAHKAFARSLVPWYRSWKEAGKVGRPQIDDRKVEEQAWDRITKVLRAIRRRYIRIEELMDTHRPQRKGRRNAH